MQDTKNKIKQFKFRQIRKTRTYRLLTILAMMLFAQIWVLTSVLGQEVENHVNDVKMPVIEVQRPTVYDLSKHEGLTADILQEIMDVVEIREFTNVSRLLDILSCESKFQQYVTAVNVHKQSDGTILTTKDRGIAQFNSYWRSDVSDECSYSIGCAVNEMISTANKDGGFKKWHCDKHI